MGAPTHRLVGELEALHSLLAHSPRDHIHLVDHLRRLIMLAGPISGKTMILESGHRIDFSPQRCLVVFGSEQKDGSREVLRAEFTCPMMALAWRSSTDK